MINIMEGIPDTDGDYRMEEDKAFAKGLEEILFYNG
jgi:hypothetical protein